MRRNILVLLLLLCGQDAVRSLRLVELRVPGHVAAGDEALLGCEFDMEGDQLYSVKWYKDGREFFRYMPRGHIQMQRFPARGVIVDLSKSSMETVSLMDLQPVSAGMFRCEVSGEAPLFDTAAGEKYISVDVLPKSGPTISGLRYSYEIGDRVVANCTSPPSKPEAQLKWLVNKKPVSWGHMRGPWLRVVQNPAGAKETTLELRFMVLPSHYRKGVMKIMCQATIAPLYQKEQSFVFTKPEPEPEPESFVGPEESTEPVPIESENSIMPDIIDVHAENLPEPSTETPSISSEELDRNRAFQDELYKKFRDFAKENNIRIDMTQLLPRTTTVQPNSESNKGYIGLTEKSVPTMLVILILQVILFL